jgi:hypothetical protein
MPGIPCWEYTKCKEKEKCPAYPSRGLDCWRVSGPLCDGDAHGSYVEKVQDCRIMCAYYKEVVEGLQEE